MNIKNKIDSIKIINFDVIHNAICGVYVYNYINNYFINNKDNYYLDTYEGSVVRYNNNLYFVSMIFDKVTLSKKIEELLDLDTSKPILSSSCINCVLMRNCKVGKTITTNYNAGEIESISDDIDKLLSDDKLDEDVAANTADKLRELKLKSKYIDVLISYFKSAIIKHKPKGGFGVSIKKRTDIILKKSAALLFAQQLALNDKFINLLSLKITLFKKSPYVDDKLKSTILNEHCEKVSKEYIEFK